MNLNTIAYVHETFLRLYNVSFNAKEISKGINKDLLSGDISIDIYLDQLVASGGFINLAYLREKMVITDFKARLKAANYPILVFQMQNGSIDPMVLFNKGGRIFMHRYNSGAENIKEIKTNDPLFDDLVCESDVLANGDEKKVLVVTAFLNNSLYSNNHDETDENAQKVKLTTLSRFVRLLVSERREISYVYIYAIIAGIISLSLPLGIQSIIGFISSGQISTSVIVLISFIILGIMLVGGLQIMQLTLVEYIQQRLFAKTAFDFTFRIPKIKVESLLKYYPPELMNRFFDIITLQKGLAKIILEFSAAILQILLGLVLLSFYHSSFIFFGMFLILVLAIIIRLSGPKGLKTSLKESKYKYLLANWLEEMARNLSTFKLAGHSNLPMEKTDYLVSGYIHARKDHFRVLKGQYISFVAFKTIVTGGLLILGSILLVEKQINLGQFVASEIVIILIMTAVEKLIVQLDTAYDVLTSLEKIAAVTDLPIEIPQGIDIGTIVANKEGLAVAVKNLKYKFPEETTYSLSDVSFAINPGEKVCIAGYGSSGKSTLINVLLGLLTSYDGTITYNNISLRSLNKQSLIDHIGDNVSQQNLFDGTIFENIALGRSQVKTKDVLWALESVGLNDYIQSLKAGIQSKITGGGLSETVVGRILIARSIVSKPQLLILQDALFDLEKQEKTRLLQLLMGKDKPWTVIMVSNDKAAMQMCDRTIVLKAGKIVCDGPYQQISNQDVFREFA